MKVIYIANKAGKIWRSCLAGQELAPIRYHRKGYLEVKIKGKIYKAHRFVWQHFNGPIPKDLQVNHINGIKHDNRLSNLELVTCSENLKHAYANGLHDVKGERHPRAKYSDAIILSIREHLSFGMRGSDIARKLGVTKYLVSDVKRGKAWKHVQ